MGDVLAFPRERNADLRIERVDPGAPGDAVYPSVAPPNDLAAEAAVLEAVMLDTEALDRVLEVLRPEHFYSDPNGRVFQAAQKLRQRGDPVDTITVRRWLEEQGMLEKVGGVNYLLRFANAAPTVAEFTADAEKAQAAWRERVVVHAGMVLDRFEDRQLIATCQRVAAEGYSIATAAALEPGEKRSERAVWREKVRAELGRATAPRAVLAGKPIGAYVEEARRRIEGIGEKRATGVRYGFDAVQEVFGLLLRGNQHVIGGRAGMGKTAFAFQVCCNVAETALDALEVGEAVYVVSGEMTGGKLVERAACSYAGLDAQRVQLGLATAEELHNLGGWMKWLRSLPIIVDDQPAEAGEIARRVRAYKTLFGAGKARDERGQLHPRCRLQLVMGDHAQKLAKRWSGLGPRDDMKAKIAAVSHGWVTDIAKGCDVATLLCSQLNRGSDDPARKDKWPRMSDLEGAAELEQDADTVLAIHRPEKAFRDTSKVPAKWRGVAGIASLKNRYGGEGVGRVARLGFERGLFRAELPPAALEEPYSEDD